MEIIHEEKDYMVVHKEAFLATQTARLGEMDLYSKVKNYLSEKYHEKEPYLAVINRLDQPVEGLVLFARNNTAASSLSSQLQSGKIEKHYLAVVYGMLPDSQKELTDYIRKNTKTNLSQIASIAMKDAKKAVLKYTKLKQSQEETLLTIQLYTGRHHQIRVQLSHLGYPLVGDLKYGSPESITYSKKQGIKTIALCAYQLAFLHLVTGQRIEYEIKPEQSEIQKLLQGEDGE